MCLLSLQHLLCHTQCCLVLPDSTCSSPRSSFGPYPAITCALSSRSTRQSSPVICPLSHRLMLLPEPSVPSPSPASSLMGFTLLPNLRTLLWQHFLFTAHALTCHLSFYICIVILPSDLVENVNVIMENRCICLSASVSSFKQLQKATCLTLLTGLPSGLLTS